MNDTVSWELQLMDCVTQPSKDIMSQITPLRRIAMSVMRQSHRRIMDSDINGAGKQDGCM